jgi:hypothetical protein
LPKARISSSTFFNFLLFRSDLEATAIVSICGFTPRTLSSKEAMNDMI